MRPEGRCHLDSMFMSYLIGVCIFLQQYRIHMDIGNSKNYLGSVYYKQLACWVT